MSIYNQYIETRAENERLKSALRAKNERKKGSFTVIVGGLILSSFGFIKILEMAGVL